MMMEMVSSLLLLACNLLLVSAGGGGYHDTWDYIVNGAIGPSNWKINASHCGGSKQSPITILTHHVVHNKDLGELKLTEYDQLETFTMKNRDTDIEFKGKATSGSKVPQKVQFKGTDYRFYQFHFHWGTENDKGSEHLVDWQRSAAEMHIIHYNDKYPNVSIAVDKADGLLVWGHFLRVNSKDNVANKDFDDMLKKFANAKTCCNTEDVKLNLFKLLPAKHDKFYTYEGGLTTPPCYESVRWVVNKDPILVSENQMKLYRQLKDKNNQNRPISNNFRPPQNLNGRKVESNFDPKATSKASIVAPCALTILTIISAMFFTL